MLRYYHVFNAAQCEGIDAKVPVTEVIEHEFNPIRAAELIAEGMPKPPTITHDKSRAYYNPALDLVNVPRAQLFRSDQEYYSTLFHELVHATGHDSRLKRHDKKESVAFGSETYSKEELVAEMGCAFLCGASGIVDMTIKNSAAYISSWLKRLKDDVTLVVTAAGQAQKASDYILNVKADGGGDDGDMT